MARILAAREVKGQGVVVCLDGDDMEHACSQDYFVEPVASGQGVVVVLTSSGHLARGQVVRQGNYQNVESLAGLVVERL